MINSLEVSERPLINEDGPITNWRRRSVEVLVSALKTYHSNKKRAIITIVSGLMVAAAGTGLCTASRRVPMPDAVCQIGTASFVLGMAVTYISTISFFYFHAR